MMVASCPLNYGQPKPSETLDFGAKFWDLVGNGSISRVHLFLVFGGVDCRFCPWPRIIVFWESPTHHRLTGDRESAETASFCDWA